MTTTDEWTRITAEPETWPAEGELTMCRTPQGEERMLRRSGHLFFVPDGEMYVYFTPAAWRPLGRDDVPVIMVEEDRCRRKAIGWEERAAQLADERERASRR